MTFLSLQRYRCLLKIMSFKLCLKRAIKVFYYFIFALNLLLLISYFKTIYTLFVYKTNLQSGGLRAVIRGKYYNITHYINFVLLKTIYPQLVTF